jgi:hypothetical protein
MHFIARMTFGFWPGSLPAWRDGDLRGLFIAIAFGAGLSIAWIASTVWPLWLSPIRLGLLWGLLGTIACVSMTFCAIHGYLSPYRTFTGCPDARLLQAQAHYLRAEYFEAEKILSPFCRVSQCDVEAALLVASILRRTERYQASIEMLDRIALLDRARSWLEEIEQEKRIVLKQKIRTQSEAIGKS